MIWNKSNYIWIPVCASQELCISNSNLGTHGMIVSYEAAIETRGAWNFKLQILNSKSHYTYYYMIQYNIHSIKQWFLVITADNKWSLWFLYANTDKEKRARYMQMLKEHKGDKYTTLFNIVKYCFCIDITNVWSQLEKLLINEIILTCCFCCYQSLNELVRQIINIIILLEK